MVWHWKRRATRVHPVSYLFILYAESAMRDVALDRHKDDIQVGEHVVINLRYADDTTLLSTSKEGLKEIIKKI